VAVDRSAMKKSLAKKQESSEKSKDDRGKFHGIFKDDVEGLNLWKVGEGDHEFDIIPYEAGKNDPDKLINPGDFTYTLILWVHRGIGINEDSYICLAKTYGKKCPVCEYQASLRDTDASDDEIKKWNPTRRTYYNVLVYDNEKEQAKGIQILDIAHYYMEPELLALSRPRSRGGADTGEKIYFASPDRDGKSISFFKEGKGLNTAYKAFKFIDRDYDLDQEIIDKAHCLDEIIHIPEYQEVKEALELGLPEEATSKKVKEEEDIPSEGRQRRGSSASAYEENKEKAPEEKKEEEKPEDKKEEEKPEEKIEEKQEKTEDKKYVCPSSEGTFGVDLEKLGACAKCTIWDPCSDESARLLELKRAARAEGGRLKR
jgi:hypothetical protein